MSEVTESIFSDDEVVIPMADVQHVEKQYTKLNADKQERILVGSLVITKHTRWDIDSDAWANNIWLNPEQTEDFLRCWCQYRHELEKDTLVSNP